ncbi:MAG TPA: adenylosuccinate lyase [Gaiellaceae bacterium]|nr:adenylosuccinate lyase [Gaiellaceae bacterium]
MPTTLDCTLFRDIFGTARMRSIFDSRALLQAWLDAEVAFAEAEAEVGVIPADAAARIREVARAERFDLDLLREQIGESQHPLVPTVRALAEAAGEAGDYVHWGATTQDIMDTGAVLQVRAALDLIEPTLEELLAELAKQARQHAGTAMVGRTHGQHAVPITFGLKLAIWTDELARTRDRLAACRARVLVGQLGGAAGTLASLGSDGPAVRAAFCRRLGLGEPATPWHTARDAFAELVSTLGILAATLEKIALEIIRLQATEVAEASEPPVDGHVGSSTMPQKRNPMISEWVAGVCKLVRGLVPVMLGLMVGEHERDMAAWSAEWLLVPQALIMTDAALVQLLPIVADLRVDEARMAANLELTRGAILAEAVMLALGGHVGRERAHTLMMAVTRDAELRGIHLLQALREHPAASELLSEEEVARLLDPTTYLGEAAGLARATAERVLGDGAGTPAAANAVTP